MVLVVTVPGGDLLEGAIEIGDDAWFKLDRRDRCGRPHDENGDEAGGDAGPSYGTRHVARDIDGVTLSARLDPEVDRAHHGESVPPAGTRRKMGQGMIDACRSRESPLTQWKKLVGLIIAASILVGASLIWSARHPRPTASPLPPFIPGTVSTQVPR